MDPEYASILVALLATTDTDERAGLLEQLHARYLAMRVGAGQTTNGLPYPDPTDPVAEGADAIRALAEALDPYVGDTGWQAAPISSAYTGGNGIGVRRVGDLVTWRGSLARNAGWTAGGAVPTGSIPTAFQPEAAAPWVGTLPGSNYSTLARVTVGGAQMTVNANQALQDQSGSAPVFLSLMQYYADPIVAS